MTGEREQGPVQAPRRGGCGTAFVGLLIALGSLLGLFWPWVSTSQGHVSVSSLHSLCNSGIGELAQAVNGGAASGCANVGQWYAGFIILAVIGVIVTIWGLVR